MFILLTQRTSDLKPTLYINKMKNGLLAFSPLEAEYNCFLVGLLIVFVSYLGALCGLQHPFVGPEPTQATGAQRKTTLQLLSWATVFLEQYLLLGFCSGMVH